MNLNLSNAIIQNVTGNTQEQLEDTIVDAIQNGEEKMLPGLGYYSRSFGKIHLMQEKQEMITLSNQD